MRSRGVTALAVVAVLATAGMLALPAGAARAAQVMGVRAAVGQAAVARRHHPVRRLRDHAGRRRRGGRAGAGIGWRDVYQPDHTLVNLFHLGPGVQLAARGLAWSADGSTLYAVTMTGSGSTPTFGLRVFRSATTPASTLTLSGPGTADITTAPSS
jgi:hypothetical protein